VKGISVTAIERNYEIHLKTEISEISNQDDDQGQEIKKKACLVTISATVNPIGDMQLSVSRSTNLCIVQAGA
jgi:hypothetical protein